MKIYAWNETIEDPIEGHRTQCPTIFGIIKSEIQMSKFSETN